jgi:hypothetical protein
VAYSSRISLVTAAVPRENFFCREVLKNHRRQPQRSQVEFGLVSALDDEGRTIWIADAHRDGKRFIVRSDEMLTAFVELERAIHNFAVSLIS